MNFFARIRQFITEVIQELKKVAWSTRQEVIGATGVVIATTCIMSVFIGIIDLLLSRFLSVLLR